jgi:rhodanese-related sulfurtransferase
MSKRWTWTLLAPLVVGAAGCDAIGPGGTRQAVQQVAAAVARGEDHVTPAILSEWLVAGTRDVGLVDLRAAQAYAAGHIRDARHLPIAEALTAAGMQALREHAITVVYSDDSEPAAQAVVLLRLAGIEAYFLRGGHRGWTAHLTGAASAETGPSLVDARRLAAACRESREYAEVRTSGFPVPQIAAAETVSAPPAAPSAAPGGTPATPQVPPPAAPPLPAYAPPVVPLETPPAPAPAEGGLIVNEGC